MRLLKNQIPESRRPGKKAGDVRGVGYTKNEMEIIKNLPPKKAVDNSAENFLCPKFAPI